MSKYTRREIAVLKPKVRPELYDLIRNGNVEGFKKLLNIYGPDERDSEEKQELVDEFLARFTARFDVRRIGR